MPGLVKTPPGLTISGSQMKQNPPDGCAGNLRQAPSFRDEGKLCSACLKCITGPSGEISLYFCPKT